MFLEKDLDGLEHAGVTEVTIYGATDDFGFKHEKHTYRGTERDFRSTDVFGNVVKKILA